MIHLYHKDNTNYEANGDVILLPTMCQATAGINRTWQIDIEHPIDEEGRWKSIDIDAVIKCPSFNGEQLWRVVQREKRDSGIVATCDPIFYDAAHDVVFIDGVQLNNASAQEAIDTLTDGTKYSGISNCEGRFDRLYRHVNLIEAITSADNSFVRTWNAEIGFNNYEVQILKELGGDYGVSVQWGKNLAIDGVSETIDIDGTITRIVPVAYNGYTLPEKYIDSPHITDYPFPRIGFLKLDYLRLWSDKQEGESGDAKTEYFNSLEELYAAMREETEKQFTEEHIDVPSVGLEVEMVLIENTEEYKDYKVLEHVSIGDTVRCYNPRLNLDAKARVRSLIYDCLTEKTISVEIGRIKRNYFDNVTSTIGRVEEAIKSDGTVVAEKIQGFINGARAQLRLQNNIAERQDVRAILYEDLDPSSPTYGALSIGTQGWQIANERTPDGRDWEWTTAATANGIIADVITAGTINGITINGSTINSNVSDTIRGIRINNGRVIIYNNRTGEVQGVLRGSTATDGLQATWLAGVDLVALGEVDEATGDIAPRIWYNNNSDQSVMASERGGLILATGGYSVMRGRDSNNQVIPVQMYVSGDGNSATITTGASEPVYLFANGNSNNIIISDGDNYVLVDGQNDHVRLGGNIRMDTPNVWDGSSWKPGYTGQVTAGTRTLNFVKGILVSVS